MTKAEKNLQRWLKANDLTATPAQLEAARAGDIRVEQINPHLWLAHSQRIAGATYPVRVSLSGELPYSSYAGRELVEQWATVIIARCACPQFHRAGSCKHSSQVKAQYADVFAPAWASLLGFDANDRRARQAAFNNYFEAARRRDEARHARALRLVARVDAEEPGALDIITDQYPEQAEIERRYAAERRIYREHDESRRVA